MLSQQVKARIRRNKRVRKHLWEMRKRYGLNRALWPSPWTIAYNRIIERDPVVFGEVFYPTIRIEPVEDEPAFPVQLIVSLGLSPDVLAGGPEFSTAEVMRRHYGV